jgi:integrase
VDKLGRQTYVLWYDFNGKRNNVYTDKDGKAWTSKEAAEDLLNTIRYEIKTNAHDPEKYRPENKNRYSIPNVLETYLESRKNDVTHGRIGEAQRKHIEKGLNGVLVPFIKLEQLRDIRELKAFHLEKLFNNGLPKWEPKTIKNFSLTLHAFFTWCVKMELIDRIPAMPNLPTANEKPIRWLDEQTQAEILNAIDEPHRPIYQFMAWYGCRPREAMALQRRDVNWEGRFIMLQRAFKHGTTELGSTKTRKIRPLPITEDTELFIRKAFFGTIGDETFLFINPLTGRNYSISSLEHRWVAAWDTVIESYKKADKPAPVRCTLTEGTRKTVATIAFNNGINENLVAGMLGNSPVILKKHYAQLTASRFDGVVGRGKVKRIQTVSKAKKGNPTA